MGGSFESRVWNGSQFVNVYNIAHFKGTQYTVCIYQHSNESNIKYNHIQSLYLFMATTYRRKLAV